MNGSFMEEPPWIRLALFARNSFQTTANLKDFFFMFSFDLPDFAVLTGFTTILNNF